MKRAWIIQDENERGMLQSDEGRKVSGSVFGGSTIRTVGRRSARAWDPVLFARSKGDVQV